MIFTICIPTYNRAHTITRTLSSLENQGLSSFEVLIIDDGSTDNTENIVKNYVKASSYNIRYFKKLNGGKYTAINLGIKEASGEFFLILDSDDSLIENALKDLYDSWNQIPNEDKKKFCGVMGKSCDQSKKMLGSPFPEEYFVSSYIDFHFISGVKMGPYGDCCEFVKTSIIQQYSFPLTNKTTFIPEAYIFDQIGINFKLLCINKVFKIVEYLPDGITNNIKANKEMNNIGYLEYYTCLLDRVFIETEERIPIKPKIITWWKYWDAISKDTKKQGPRCRRISLLGFFVFICRPLLNGFVKNRILSRR